MANLTIVTPRVILFSHVPMTEMPPEINVVFKENYSIESFLAAYDISRRRFYDEVKCGNLEIYKYRDRTFVTRESAQKWLREVADKADKKLLPHRRNKKPDA